jgi:hypothetical protein
MWTSLLPVAWSARSPWRVLFSVVGWSGLALLSDKMSARFRNSASLYWAASIRNLSHATFTKGKNLTS